MNQQSYDFPPMPVGAKEEMIEPSSEFKKEVFKVGWSILFFCVVYLALIISASILAIACAYAGFYLIITLPKFITIMIGFGMIGLGIMVLYFLLKFIFSKKKNDLSGMIEIKEADHPKLFSFIKKLTKETQTPFPKKIYLSPDVNASVFYDSSFWSMFFPIKKNLVIGLGLVNTVNISEFKAILAHEFGHFSQRSMKLGSYVYNVNKVIYNMLYENEGYGNTLDQWANTSSYFAVFASLTIKIVQGIQWILQKVYGLVNKNYMSLSRQMEFHADSVAAYVSGSSHLISSLYRLEASGLCYNTVFNKYNGWSSESFKPKNVYPQHQLLMKYFGEEFNIPLKNNLLQMNAQSLAFFNQSRIYIKDQWASHPSNEDREKHLLSLNVDTEAVEQPAWILFSNAELVQEKMTDKVFEGVPFRKSPSVLNEIEFINRFLKDKEDVTYPKIYNGLYDDYDINPFDPSEFTKQAIAENYNLENLFSESNSSLPKVINALKADINLLDAIAQEGHNIKTFDFDGQKYKIDHVAEVKRKLQNELEEKEKKLKELDGEIFKFFYKKAVEKNQGAVLVDHYNQLFNYTKEQETDIKMCEELFKELSPLYNGIITTVEEAKVLINLVKDKEKPIKARILSTIDLPEYIGCLTENQRSILMDYANAELNYFTESNFNVEAIQKLNEAVTLFANRTGKKFLMLKKALLAFQFQL
jgi:Zn-dependent protease with chaperone function